MHAAGVIHYPNPMGLPDPNPMGLPAPDGG